MFHQALKIILADDLTGAAEIAALLFRSRLRTRILTGNTSNLSKLAVSELDYWIINTDTRTLSAKEAGERLRDMLSGIEAPLFYKKIDSLLRGPVLGEIQALQDQGKCKRVILLPENPSLGRTVRDGIYRVDGSLLEYSPLAADPDSPAISSKIERLLKTEAGTLTYLKPFSGEGLMGESTLYFGEAESKEEVAFYPSLLDGTVLPVGGSDFFQAILETQYPAILLQQTPYGPEIPPIQFFVSGSAHRVSHEFFQSLEDQGCESVVVPGDRAGDDHFWREVPKMIFGPLSRKERVTLRIGKPLLDSEDASSSIAKNLVKTVSEILKSHSTKHLYLEGGTTAGQVFRSCGWTQFEVVKVWNKGAVTLRSLTSSTLKVPFITLKPSSFPWPKELIPLGHSNIS